MATRRSKDAVLVDSLGERWARTGRVALAARARRDAARRTAPSRSHVPRWSERIFFALVILLLLAASAAAQVQLPEGNSAEPIIVGAQAGNRWELGSYEVWVLRGDCTIRQGNTTTRCREAVLWIDRAEAFDRRPHKVIAYLEGDVRMVVDRQSGAPRLTDQTWFGRFYSVAGVEVRATKTVRRPDSD